MRFQQNEQVFILSQIMIHLTEKVNQKSDDLMMICYYYKSVLHTFTGKKKFGSTSLLASLALQILQTFMDFYNEM